MTDNSSRRIRIFLSSPSDVKAERDALKHLIEHDLMRTLGDDRDLYLEPIMWETHTIPGMGNIQDNIFDQIGGFDIFVGFFWQRFGTPTGTFDSGSEAEFHKAYEMWQQDNALPVLMYFCNRPYLPTADNIEQITKVLHFKQEIGDKGLYWEYGEVSELKDLVRVHLHKAILRLLGEDDEGDIEPMDQAYRTYLGRLLRRCRLLPLGAFGFEHGAEDDVTLDQVYINLLTTSKQKIEKDGEEEEISITALEAVQNTERLVLLGDPGSGKSTFVKQLLVTEAKKALDGDASGLPVFVTLRALAPRLVSAGKNALTPDKRRHLLARCVLDYVIDDVHALQLSEAVPVLQEAFRTGDVQLVLDGLDEVPFEARSLVRETVGALLDHHDLKRVIVTCRIRSYTEESRIEGFDAHTLAPFDDAQIQQFIAGWYDAQMQLGALKTSDTARLTTDLQQAVNTQYLRQLAPNPMLLTTMIMVHQEDKELPRQRVVLYERAVDILLRKWEKDKGQLPEDMQELLSSKERIRPIVQRLAFEAHKKKRADAAADLPRHEAIHILEQDAYLGDLAFAGRFLDYVDERSGLLIGLGGSLGKPAAYSFPHRTFQEYLAGCYLINNPRSAAREIRKLAKEGDFWSEAVLLGAQELLFNRENPYQLLDNANSMMPQEITDQTKAREALWSAQMAHEVGREAVLRDEETGQAYLDNAGAALLNSLHTDLPPVERAEAGRLLAHLGDPDPAVLDIDKMQFCYVPAGPFIMGSPEDTGDDDEHPQHTLDLNYSYWIGQSPVTQAQYKGFVEAGGYDQKEWWTAKGWQEKEGRDWTGQEIYGNRFNLPNHPVVGVSWYEAYAFTQWLTARWRSRGFLEKEGLVQLPNEPEWEKAARGGIDVPSAPLLASLDDLPQPEQMPLVKNNLTGKQYHWGNTFDAANLNMGDTGIGSTTRAGCFPACASCYGTHDMSGNVWEWMRNKSFPSYPYPLTERDWEAPGGDDIRVVRGGSWINSGNLVRCAYRGNNLPFNRLYDWGFRVIALPKGGGATAGEG
ncbi:MAG: SUMF1/EgtB/PvdO family nonheme iron enzyme [Bacteroidota bacterium]